ncbi:E4 ubiquitin-protein ligase UFD2-like 6 [Homarus americanus]|uniref:E4 ubiquitin-protein ligase UFD2-like 6 n=1 Tax=Homarus americanus TaxID=6706 RepID=A0A8J5N350_HOMAM|nr:E4 ubiquitin-protein ligase UFD2-like 6 [Homarus americanus]
MADFNRPTNNDNWLMFKTASASLSDPRVCVNHVLHLIKMASDGLDVVIPENGVVSVAQSRVFLAVHCVKAVVERYEGPPAKITDKWETILWAIVRLVRHWQPGFTQGPDVAHPTHVKPWLLHVFSHPEMCPNFHLRLEMIRFIGMWPQEDFRDKRVGQQVAAGLVSTTSRLELDHLMHNYNQCSLMYILNKVLELLNTYGHLHIIAATALRQVKNLQVGPEVQCLARLVEVASQRVVQLLNWYKGGFLSTTEVLARCEKTLVFIRLLLTGSGVKAAYESPGLAQTAATSLLTATSSIVSAAFTLQSQDPNGYHWLIGLVDTVFFTMAVQEKPQSVMAVMRRNHGQCFSAINQQAADSGYPLYHLPRPCEEQTDNCPEMYIDSVTQQVMEAPVLLKSSKMIVDESTLVHLLLVSPTDPFTRCPLYPGSYTRLPHLRDEIVAWRNRSSSTSHGHNTAGGVDDITRPADTTTSRPTDTTTSSRPADTNSSFANTFASYADIFSRFAHTSTVLVDTSIRSTDTTFSSFADTFSSFADTFSSFAHTSTVSVDTSTVSVDTSTVSVDASTTGFADASTTGFADASTTGFADASTTGFADASTRFAAPPPPGLPTPPPRVCRRPPPGLPALTGFADASTTGLPAPPPPGLPTHCPGYTTPPWARPRLRQPPTPPPGPPTPPPGHPRLRQAAHARPADTSARPSRPLHQALPRP